MKSTIKYILTFVLILSSEAIFAQGGPPLPPSSTSVPLDGGLLSLLLLGGGGALAYRRMQNGKAA